MVQQFAKPQEAREIEARARAKRLGVKVAVVVEASRYVAASQSTPGTVYVQQRTPAGWACSCDGYMMTGVCKHIAQVERRSERDGWDFGAICPLHRAARYFPLDLPENIAVQGAVIAVTQPASVLPFPQRDPAAAAARRQFIDSELYG